MLSRTSLLGLGLERYLLYKSVFNLSLFRQFLLRRERGEKYCDEHVCLQGRRQVKKCGVDMHGERAEREPIMGSGGGVPSGVMGQSPYSGGIGGKAP